MFTASRYHDISCGHRVVGHEGKCRYLHGHNYRIHFICEAGPPPIAGGFALKQEVELDVVGRVIDFGVIKERLCYWVENEWDHRMLLWEKDPWRPLIEEAIAGFGITAVPFNPTAENMAQYLVTKVGPDQLLGTNVRLRKVIIEETRKCSASYELEY